MSKESTLVTPALSLLFAFALGAKNKKNISIGIFAQALACLFYVGLRWYALQRFAFPEQDAFVKDASWVRHYFVACQVLWMYGSLLLFPISLSCDYSSFSISPFWPCLLLALLVFLSVYIFWRFQEKMPVFCLFWFICALAPVLHFFPLMVVVAERLLYPATPAATLFFSWCIFKTSRGKALLLLSTSLLAFCMVLLIHSRCADWKNNAVLWRKTLQTNPKSYRALIYLGSEAANQALLCNNKNYGLEKAVTYYFQALQCNPNKTNRILIYSNLGIVYFWLRDFQQSNDYCHQALQLNPKHRGTLLFLAEIAWKKQEWNQALHFYRQMPEKINRWDTLFEKF
jgi:tetratricopeptide (TPR) repeat protein